MTTAENNIPVIGITPLWDREKNSLWMLPGYMEGIRLCGGLPVMLPLMTGKEEARKAAIMCDGILLTGGQDVSPGLYGETILNGRVETAPERDLTESLLLDCILETDMPVLGICRGIQFLNAYLGGTLYQDLPSQLASEVVHNQGRPYDKPIHEVKLKGELKELIGKDSTMVNSLHHQAVRIPAPSLIPMAEAPDGVVEAVMMEGKKFVWAVQWHPEFMIPEDDDSMLIFRRFVEECRKK